MLFLVFFINTSWFSSLLFMSEWHFKIDIQWDGENNSNRKLYLNIINYWIEGKHNSLNKYKYYMKIFHCYFNIHIILFTYSVNIKW